MPIRVLPKEVASAIAAGEVVERPMSVVKELLENSLDAAATRIDISVERGGSGLVEVADNGCGIPSAEVHLAVARYATSKLCTVQDLFALSSLGFRGEALSSIAAVSRLELVTRVSDEEAGTRLVVEGGQAQKASRVGAPAGTSVRVRDLFYNVPARKKFLKSETTERRRIVELVTRYALAYPKVAMRLMQEGREVFHSTGSGDRRETLAAVFGLDLARQLLPLVESQAGPIRLEGYVGPPSLQRTNRSDLTFFVNGRWVRDPSLAAAVVQAYHGLLMVGRFPVAVLLLEMPPESIDVNVHPAKAEIRFRQPEQVFMLVQRAVRATLLGQAPPAVSFGAAWQRPVQDPLLIGRDWQAGHDDRHPPWATTGTTPQIRLPSGDVPLLRAVGQVGGTYLVAEGPDGLYLIDQHAAHERVLYEGMMDVLGQASPPSQILLDPLTVEFSASEVQLLERALGLLGKLGFEVEAFGVRSFRVRAVPALLAHSSPELALRAVVSDIEEDESPLLAEKEARLVARICKRAAVKAGQVLSLAEQQQLLHNLEKCQVPRTCPHGRPTLVHLSVEALERQFGRRG